MRSAVLVSLISLALAACQSRNSSAPATPAVRPAATHVLAASATPPPMAVALAPQINGGDFLRYARVLSLDGGRRPSSRAQAMTTRYLIAQLRRMRLAPGNRGSWLQSVPAVAITLRNTGVQLAVSGPAGTVRFVNAKDMTVATQRPRALVSLRRSPVVFLGYGIDAPQWQWNDYAGVDVRGKTVVVLANNPRFANGGPRAFNGRGLTWYGLAAYKLEQAARMGAAACFIVHTTASAGVSWQRLQRRARAAQWSLAPGAEAAPRLAVRGWLTRTAAQRLFHAAGLDFEALRQQAGEPGFHAVPLDVTASITLRNAIVHRRADDVLALVRGHKHPDQVVIYSAPWDPATAQRGTGLASLLEIADAFAHRKTAPDRSVLFLMPARSDAGLLGLRYYVAHPVFPLARTVADLNIDAWPILGRARDITVIGAGQSELEDELRQVLEPEGRVISPETTAQNGLYFRAEELSFARAGVPTLIVGPGLDLIEGGRTAGLAAAAAYLSPRPARSVFAPAGDLSGTLEDIETLYLLGRRLADSDAWPNWYTDSIFRPRRDAMMARAARR
jgi:Zn-dependent M28 family amino/carboxypeptidase